MEKKKVCINRYHHVTVTTYVDVDRVARPLKRMYRSALSEKPAISMKTRRPVDLWGLLPCAQQAHTNGSATCNRPWRSIRL
jgi:hypothetical protein